MCFHPGFCQEVFRIQPSFLHPQPPIGICLHVVWKTTSFLFCHLTTSFGAFNSHHRRKKKKKNSIYSLFGSVPQTSTMFLLCIFFMRVLLYFISFYVECKIYISIFLNSVFFWDVKGKTTYSPEEKYRPHDEITTSSTSFLYFLPIMSSFLFSSLTMIPHWSGVFTRLSILNPTSSSQQVKAISEPITVYVKLGLVFLEHHFTFLGFHLLLITMSFNTLWPTLEPSQISFIWSRVELKQYREACLVSAAYAIASKQNLNTY